MFTEVNCTNYLKEQKKKKKRKKLEGVIDFLFSVSWVFMLMVNEDRLEMIHLVCNLLISPSPYKHRDKQILSAFICLKGNQMNGFGIGPSNRASENTLTHNALEVVLQTQYRPLSI